MGGIRGSGSRPVADAGRHGESGSEDRRPSLCPGAGPAPHGQRPARATGQRHRGATAQRQSEFGAGIRLIDAIGADRDKIVPLITEPFGFYQVGFDASWELDLWGRIRSSVEQADADVARQGALLDLAQVSLASDVARGFFELRTTQRQIGLRREEIAAMEDRLSIIAAQVEGGLGDELFLERQRADLAALKSQLPPLLAHEAASGNEIALLVGERPGGLQDSARTARHRSLHHAP